MDGPKHYFYYDHSDSVEVDMDGDTYGLEYNEELGVYEGDDASTSSSSRRSDRSDDGDDDAPSDIKLIPDPDYDV